MLNSENKYVYYCYYYDPLLTQLRAENVTKLSSLRSSQYNEFQRTRAVKRVDVVHRCLAHRYDGQLVLVVSSKRRWVG